MNERIISEENDTIAAICMRYYGYTKGVVEAVLNDNPHLDKYSAALPYGVVITMPEPPRKTTQSTISLW